MGYKQSPWTNSALFIWYVVVFYSCTRARLHLMKEIGPVSSALTADGSGANWSKIDVFNVKDGKMANVIMMENNGKYTFKLPTNLASGEYLVCILDQTRTKMFLHGCPYSFDLRCWRCTELVLSEAVSSILGRKFAPWKMLSSYFLTICEPSRCMQIKITGPGGDCSPKFSLPGIYSVVHSPRRERKRDQSS